MVQRRAPHTQKYRHLRCQIEKQRRQFIARD